jgi:hypothetical protein
MLEGLSMLSFIVAAALLQAGGARSSEPGCRVSQEISRLRELPEASGVAASRRTQGVFWAHNDSSIPVLFALDVKGAVTRPVKVAGASVDDWEDVAVGPCAQRSCVYIADIGDNNKNRDHITVYRAPEPSPQDASTGSAEAFEAVYPDGAHDAESLFVTSEGDVFIITKGDPGPVAVYRFPRPLTPGKRMQLQRVGAPMIDTKKVEAKDRPTAAAASPDGNWVVVRTSDAIVFYRTADLIAGRWREAFRSDVSSLKEPRGEGITFAAGGSVVLVGEGGGLGAPGTFALLSCTFPR